MRKHSIVAAISSFLALGMLTGCGHGLNAHGNIVDVPAPEIRLPYSGHAAFDLRAERGKEVVLFFGYTHCGDVCPTTLSHVAQAIAHLGKVEHSVETVFISVDPHRDTPAVAARYARQFNPAFIGVTGSPQQLASIEHDYHVWSKAMPPDKHGNYDVSHSSQLFLIAPDGRERIIDDWDMSVSDLTDDLQALQ